MRVAIGEEKRVICVVSCSVQMNVGNVAAASSPQIVVLKDLTQCDVLALFPQEKYDGRILGVRVCQCFIDHVQTIMVMEMRRLLARKIDPANVIAGTHFDDKCSF